MSKLRNKLAAVPDIKVTGYKLETINEPVIYTVETSDENLKMKIAKNSLSETERAFIINSVAEYYDSKVQQDEELFNYTVVEIVANNCLTAEERTSVDVEKNKNDEKTTKEIITPVVSLPKGLIDLEALSKFYAKKRGGNIIFDRTKFKNADFADKVKVVTDYMEFFQITYGEDFMSPSYDIKYLISVPGIEQYVEKKDPDEMVQKQVRLLTDYDEPKTIPASINLKNNKIAKRIANMLHIN